MGKKMACGRRLRAKGWGWKTGRKTRSGGAEGGPPPPHWSLGVKRVQGDLPPCYPSTTPALPCYPSTTLLPPTQRCPSLPITGLVSIGLPNAAPSSRGGVSTCRAISIIITLIKVSRSDTAPWHQIIPPRWSEPANNWDQTGIWKKKKLWWKWKWGKDDKLMAR